jgi:hypothetical protein
MTELKLGMHAADFGGWEVFILRGGENEIISASHTINNNELKAVTACIEN